MVTKEQIVDLLKTRNDILARALVVLNNRQTDLEQKVEDTRFRNNRGFTPYHAKMGTSMAKFYNAKGYLTEKQVAYWRKEMPSGRMRIEIYSGQLLQEAKEKESLKAVAARFE